MGTSAVTFDPSTVVGLDDKPVPPVTFDSSTAVGLDDKPIPPVTFDSSSVVGLDDKPLGPVNPYANEMDSVPGSIPGMQTPQQVAGPHPEQQPVEKASIADVLSGMPAPAAAANVARDQRTVNAVRQFVHGPESAEEQNAQIQAIQHPTDQQSIESVDPILASVPVGVYKANSGIVTIGSSIENKDPNELARGVTKTIGGVSEAGTIPMGIAIAQSPIRMAIGLTEGMATGAGFKAVAQKMNLSPDQVEAATAIGFFAPMAYQTAIGLELTQEQQGTVNRVRASAFGGRVQAVAATSPESVGVAGQVGPFKFGWAKPRDTGVNFSSQGPTTGLGGGPEPPEAAAPAQGRPTPRPAPGGGSAPQFFLQSADPAGVVTPRLVSQIAGLIQGAPVEQRAALAIQAHDQTAKQALAKGSALGANGKTIPITTPEQAQQVVSGMFASVGLPRPAPPPSPSPVAVQQNAQAQTIAEVASSSASINHQADQIAGLAPPPPPPPKPGDPGSMQMQMPAGMDQGLLTQDTVNKAGAAIQALPPAIRPHAILEATGNLAKWLFGQKTAIGPDGKVVNVDSQKAAQTVAVKIINDEVDRQTEQAKATQETQQKAIQERQESAKQAQEERDQAISPETKKPAEKSTGLEQPVEIPDTPATQKAAVVLAAAPMEATAEQLDALIRRTATVTAGVRKRLVEQEIRRRANRQEDHAQAGMMGESIAPGQSREELQRWADAVGKGEHPYVHVPANVAWKPAGVEDLARTQVKGAGPFSGTYYHAKEISPADIRKAARDKTDAQGALDALAAKWKGETPAVEQKPIELKSEDVETEAGTAGSKEPQEGEGITSAPGAQPVSSPHSEEQPSNQVAKREVPSESKEVKRGEVGMMLGAGEMLLTATGRETTPFPKIDTDSNRKAGNTLKRVDQWLMDNAIAEAKARGDEFNLRQFEHNKEKPSQADKDSAEIYLFDKESVQPIPKPLLTPVSSEAPKSEQSANSIAELPADIAKSKPRYGYRDKNFELEFEDPRDLAAYTVGQKTPNRAHDRFMDYLRETVGDDAAIKVRTQTVKDALKALAKDADPADGPLKVPSQENKEPEAAVTLPPEAATGLTALVDDHAAEDPTATLDDVLRHKDTGSFIAQALVNDGIITNSADNVNPKTGLLTTSAKAKVGDALLAELLPPAVIEQTPEFLKQKLLGTMGAIKGIQSAGEGWNLQDQIVAATERYGQIFRGLDTHDQGPVVEAILKKLDDPIDKVRAAFSSFAVAATNHDPSDKPFFDFNLAFGTELTQEQYAAGLKPTAKPTAAVNTIAGKMDLDEFESHGYAPEQVTREDWTNLQRAARRAMGQSEESGTPYAPYSDYEGFHEQAVKDALKRGEEVDPEVLKDYPNLKESKPELSYTSRGAKLLQDVMKGVAERNPDQQPIVEQKPLAKGDKVTYRTNKGKERSGEVAWTDGKKVRITDNGSTVNRSIEDVKPVSSPAAVEQVSPGGQRERWQMTLADAKATGWFQSNPMMWTGAIFQALKDGKPVPEKVISDFEDYTGTTINAPEEKATPEPAADATLVDALQLKFEHGAGPKNYNDLKKIVTEFDGTEPDQLRMKEAQEAYEAAQNRVAADIARKADPFGAHSLTGRAAFDQLVNLYERQPNLSIRTSTSIANQAYSTPLPLAFVADRFAGIDFNKTVYEPTAGNGALLIAANPDRVTANELNPARAATLEDEGFKVHKNDASVWVPTDRVDAVVANPPFGPLAGPVKVDNYSIVKLDHLIIAKALSAMKDDGKAAVIMAAGDREKPGEITNQVRPFFNWLYAHYNVVSDFELEGDLYSRQGASYPVRMIAIDGRVRSAKVSPVADSIPRLETWEEVYGKAAEHMGPNLEGQRPADNVAGGPVRDESADTGAVSRTATGRNRPTDSGEPEASPARTGSDGGTEPQPGPIAHSGRVASPRVGSTDSTVRPDGDVARSDRLAEGQPAPRTVRRGTAEPDGHSANALADESNQFQASYRPRSEKKDVAVMAPKALIAPMQKAMDRVAEEAGDIDQWVTDQLGYPDVETMHQAFMGLQTDAIAAAIHQMQRGKAVVIGDQTGVGKGRVAAAMIRWAELHGHTPVFVTESAPLFSPMYADLQDIGSGQTISPLLFNADASITDPKTGLKIFQNPGAMRPVLDRIRETGELPKGRNAVFLTYSQINTDNRQQLTLQRIAPNAIFILDESHNAGGDSNTGNFLSELLTGSKGVVFLSATWAKRPDNLPLYAGKTDISIAIPDRALVASAIQAGGAPLQAVLTSLLAETGQFVRRERSFDGIEIKNMVDEKNQAEHTRIADKVTEVLRGIVEADAMYHNLDFARIQAQAKKAGKAGDHKGLVVQHMEFSALVHNMVKQLLLALKAKTAADEIIASIERGEKPVFALENTMGAFLDSYITGHNLKEGDSLKDLTYSKISDRALMRTRYYNETDEQGNKNRVEFPLDDLSAPVREAYNETQALIDALDVDLPVSPIDYIRNEVEKAGYKIAEITGRGARIDYSGEVPVLGTVPGIERKDRVNTATQFNNGGLDALIINRAGSTGISLHSSEKFRDQRMRHMIIGQPAGDVNIVMQILGRVNRTGQLLLPKYTFLAVALPAEMRPAINLAKKMKSLNANVSSNTRAATSIEAVDLMNKYGDRTVGQYLSDNPEMSRLLNLTPDTNEKGEPTANEGLAMKATGHSALLPVSQQQEFMDSITEAYTNYIDFLDETGQNDLEPRTYDYAARELHTERMYQGVDPSSPFGQDATYGEYSIKRQGKPFTPEEVMQKIADTFGPAAMQFPPRERDTLAARQLADHMEEMYKPYYAGLSQPGSMERAQQMRTRGRQLLNDYRVGTGLRIEVGGESYNGVVTNIEGAKKPHGNPYAPSSLQFTIAVNGGLRQTKVPGSQMDSLVTSNLGRNADVRQLFKDYGTDRQKAKIITGNLLGAFGELKQGTKGRIISFTMEDGTSKLGILMPSKFDIKQDVTGTYAMRVPEAAAKFLEQNGSYLQGSQSEIGVFGPTNSRDEMEIRTKTAKSAAGRFFLDPALLDTVQGGEFASSGGLMKATVKEGRELDALKVIMGKISLYASPSHIDEARSIDEKAKAELEKPKPPRRASGSVTMSFLGAGALDPYVTKALQPVVDYAKKAVAATWEEITKAAGKSTSLPKQIGYDIASVLYPPVLASSTARDIMGKAVGEPAFEVFKAAQLLQSVDKMFEHMTEPEWVEFVDRIQTQKKQDTESLGNAQTMLQAVLERQRAREQWVINLGRKPKSAPISLKDKDGYFPNRYSKPPGDQPLLSEDEEIAKIFPKRPFEGTQTFKRQQRYTLKGAVAEGAVPLGNPVRMVMRRLQEGAKFVAANEAMWNGRQAGLVLYKSPKGKMPPDFVKINDKIAQVWRPIETSEGDVAFIQGGEWIIEKDFGRLLNNFLSTDHIRNTTVGRGFVTLKNVSQACKLGFSVFHYGVQTFWQVTSALHTGLDQLYNEGIRGLDFEPSAAAVKKLAGVVVSPFTLVHGGTQVMKYFKDTQEFLASKNGRRMLETYPDLPELVRLAFVGGFKPGLNEDFTQSAAHTNPARELAAGRLIGATLTTIPWLARGVAIPLFQHIIPRVKLMQNVQMISQKLWQYSEAIEDGSITPETVARNVVLMNEASFGELNYQNNFWNNTFKTAVQLLIGFPGWKEGTWLTPARAVRETLTGSYEDQFYKGIEDDGRTLDWARKYTKRLPQLGLNAGRLLSAAIVATGIATMVGKATTGNWLWDEIQQDREKYGLNVVQAADLEILHPRLHGQVDPTTGKTLRFNLPADLRDYEHAIVAPGAYVYHSLAPWVQGTVDTMRNRNGFDNYVYNPAEPPGKGYEAFKQGLFYNLQETVEPITASNAFQQAGQQDVETKIERTLGVTGGAPPDWDMSRAEAYEKELIRSHHAPLTPEEEYAREQHSKGSIITAARSGDNEYLERAFKELSYTDAKQLFNDPAVTPSERAVLKPLLDKKRIDSAKAATRAARRR